MRKVYEEVLPTDLVEFNRKGGREELVYASKTTRESTVPPVKVPLVADPGPEKLREWLQDVIDTFQAKHGWKPGYILFARKGEHVGLMAFMFAPPAGATFVERFDFEPLPN